MIVDGYCVVLKKADHPTPVEDGILSIRIEDLEGGVTVKDLIHTVIMDFVPEAAESVRGSEDVGDELNGILRRGVSRMERSQFQEQMRQDCWDVIRRSQQLRSGVST